MMIETKLISSTTHQKTFLSSSV